MRTCGNCVHGLRDQDEHGSPTGLVNCKLTERFCESIKRACLVPPCIWIAPTIVAATKDASKCVRWEQKP